MRKLTAKLLIASIVALGVIVLASPVEVLAKKKVKTEKVTIIKGRNQCFTFRKPKLKKIKVKYSKKKIATARMKKGTDLGAYIRIDGKKLGQTTITVKAYFSNKKCKTFKYKVKVTTYLQIANSAAAKKKAKKAFALQNKYRKQAVRRVFNGDKTPHRKRYPVHRSDSRESREVYQTEWTVQRIG